MNKQFYSNNNTNTGCIEVSHKTNQQLFTSQRLKQKATLEHKQPKPETSDAMPIAKIYFTLTKESVKLMALEGKIKNK